MQSWSRQTECIFCFIRRDIQRQVVPSIRREYHTAPPPHKERIGPKLTIDRGALNRNSRQDDDKPGVKKGKTPGSYAARRLGILDDKRKAESRKTVVEQALKHVKTLYQSKKMRKDSDVSQMQGLDPEGVLWPQFEILVMKAMDGKKNSGRWGELGVQLRNAPLPSMSETAERELRFAFLDYVVDQRPGSIFGDRVRYNVRYPTEWYPAARRLQRTIHLHVGPTNSGKTYNALKRLGQAESGFYAGPLRLLAHEVYSRFNDRGVKCDLITGDDIRLDDDGEAKLYASTVEMVDTTREADVGVIDEIQMIGHNERGWAWTRALLGTRVKELHLCGEARSVPLIRELVASMGDTLHIHQYERLNPLKVMSRSMKGSLQNLRKGDCVVSFSVIGIHALKRQIEVETGRRCAIVYGSLPPDTRAQQAALFNDPDNDYDFLVASDAIGMGLNLSIKRIIFETVKRWNGKFRELLSIPQIKQIAGRAGRYRTAQDDKASTSEVQRSTDPIHKVGAPAKSIGLVTCLDEADLPVLQNALSNDGPPLTAAGILPPGEVFVDFGLTVPEQTPFEYIMRRVCSSIDTLPRYQVCTIKDQTLVARWIEDVENLNIATRLMLCASPATFSTTSEVGKADKVINALAKVLEAERKVTVADIPEIPLEILDEPMTSDRKYLATLEALHKCLILFLWLSYRYPRNLINMDMAVRAKQLCEERINATLLRFSANPKLVQRLKEMQKSSEMLIQQARERGLPADTGLIMNPDRTVDEIDAAQRANESGAVNERHLEGKLEVEAELDVGDGEEILEIDEASNDTGTLDDADGAPRGEPGKNSHTANSGQDGVEVVNLEADSEEAHKAQSSG